MSYQPEYPGRDFHHSLPPEFVSEQIKVVAQDLPIQAAKTGMLFSRNIIEAVATSVEEEAISHLVVDPVMRATSGAALLQPDAEQALVQLLIPRAELITPNGPEAEVLLGRVDQPIQVAEMEDAAKALAEKWQTAVLLKGGHLIEQGETSRVRDILVTSRDVIRFERPAHNIQAHGSGCTLSAAITAYLALGTSLETSVAKALEFIDFAFSHPITVGAYPILNRLGRTDPHS